MTRKDYEAIASVLARARLETRTRAGQRIVDDIAARLADRLALDNPHFDRARFLRACTP